MNTKIEKSMDNKEEMMPKIWLRKYFYEVLKPSFGRIVNNQVIIKNLREAQSF